MVTRCYARTELLFSSNLVLCNSQVLINPTWQLKTSAGLGINFTQQAQDQKNTRRKTA
jgi:hypothetical protein